MPKYCKILFFFFLFSLFSCKKEPQHTADGKEVTLQYARYLRLKQQENTIAYTIGDSQFKTLKINPKRVIVNGTSIIGYLKALQLQSYVVGVNNSQYISDSIIQNDIKAQKIAVIGNQSSVDIEKILSLKPDVFLSYSDPNLTKVHEKLESMGIPVVLVNEFREEKPLGKAEWLLFFGLLFNKEKEATDYFKNVEQHYNQLVAQNKQYTQKPTVLTDIMYGDVWYLPHQQSFMVQFIADAGGEYIFKNHIENPLTLGFQTVFEEAQNTDVWINASNCQSLAQLAAKNNRYQLFKAFKNQEVYAITGKQKEEANDYFETGITRPDLILNDLSIIFHHPQDISQLVFYRKLVR